ncbi:hypothetical protein DEI99_005260 [Curtobacterium sp. MCLR17_036]|uniref:hypothetical protein n=1 Tax=Curtobacterium sp. MCLR17_036 TaxID=2175620 RepID=UPI000DA70D8C|nr:hypothetical protein [Curtobacterium sp. MCLR17_036]WIE65948.1 hypothetical protein DEI99_005260 [Curtobacterium sp. MCLR17_036]
MSDTTTQAGGEQQQTAEQTATTTEQQQKQGDPANADLGDAGKKAIAAERDARKAAEKTAADLKAQLDKIEQANLSDLEKAQKRADAAEKALQATQSESLRLTIASKHGLTGDAVDLLHGSDEAELEARAARIAALTKAPGGPVVPGVGKTPAAAPENTNDWLRNLAKH